MAIDFNEAQTSDLWGCTKTYSAIVGGAVGAGNLVGSVAQKTVGMTPAGKAISIGVVGGTAIGEGIDWLISRWWDPVEPMYSVNPVGSIVTGISDQQIDAIIPQIMEYLLPGHNLTVNNILDANAFYPGLGDATLAFLRAAVRTSIYALQGPAAYYYGSIDETNLACSELRNQLQIYILTIQELAPKLAVAQVPYFDGLIPLQGEDGVLVNVTQTGYHAWLDSIRQYGTAWLPNGEEEVMNLMFTTAGTYFSGTIGEGLVDFLANDVCALEDSVFDAHNDMLTFSEVLLTGIDIHWSGIDLSASPICYRIIPTLTEWGLIIFGVVLLGFITWVFLKRRKKVIGVRV
jgi:hypothetical protein